MSHSYYVRMHEPSEDLYLLAYDEADELVAAARIDVQDAREHFEYPESQLTWAHGLLETAPFLDGGETVEWARQEHESAWSDALSREDIARMAE